jgi:nitric oxide reductase activation protein
MNAGSRMIPVTYRSRSATTTNHQFSMFPPRTTTNKDTTGLLTTEHFFPSEEKCKLSKMVLRASKRTQQAKVSAKVAETHAAEDSEEEKAEVAENEEDSDDSESEEEEDVTALFKGGNVPEEKDSEEGSENSGDEGDGTEDVAPTNHTMKGAEECTFDLRNMLAVNSHQLASNSLYTTKKPSKSEEFLTIPLDKGHGLNVDEEFLLSKASAGCTQLVRALWQLPTESSDAGPLITLPGYGEIKIPRALVSF